MGIMEKKETKLEQVFTLGKALGHGLYHIRKRWVHQIKQIL
jgi:hypothetical protein